MYCTVSLSTAFASNSMLVIFYFPDIIRVFLGFPFNNLLDELVYRDYHMSFNSSSAYVLRRV